MRRRGLARARRETLGAGWGLDFEANRDTAMACVTRPIWANITRPRVSSSRIIRGAPYRRHVPRAHPLTGSDQEAPIRDALHVQSCFEQRHCDV